MKYYHLYDSGEGMKLGFLGICATFDEADTVAQKLVEENKVSASIWILSEPDVQTLFSSIKKEIPDMEPILVDMRKPPSRLPAKFIEDKLPIAQKMTMMGVPVPDLDRESMMATIACGFMTVEAERKHHTRSLEMMTALKQIQKGK